MRYARAGVRLLDALTDKARGWNPRDEARVLHLFASLLDMVRGAWRIEAATVWFQNMMPFYPTHADRCCPT